MSWYTLAVGVLVALPLVTRSLQAWRHRALRKERLLEDQAARDSSRIVVIALATFAFTGVVGVAVLENATRRAELEISVAFFLVSFLFSVFALQLENYKFVMPRQILSLYLTESAILMLLIAIVSIVATSRYSMLFKTFVAMLSFGGWLVDHVLEWRYMENHLRLVGEQRQRQQREETQRKEEQREHRNRTQ